MGNSLRPTRTDALISDINQSHICTDPVILDQWHPIAVLEAMRPGITGETTMLGVDVGFTVDADDNHIAWRLDSPSRDALPVLPAYGYLWASLGSPPDQLFEIPEYGEPDRRNIHAATIGVQCSAPRAIENFLDMGHFPYVHTGILGIEPHTEVVEYDVHIEPTTNEIWATECFFYQPVAAATAVGGQMSEYVYRVPHPYCVLLYKSCPLDPSRMDVIGLFARSVSDDYIEASMFLSLIDDGNSEAGIRRFQQTIFAQDKPILENQHPKLLPLDPRFETPIRADKVAIMYRRWLTELGVSYGVIRAA